MLQDDLRNLMTETIEEFNEIIEKMEDMTNEMLYKHGQQLIDMQNEISKLYGVNLKYVKTADVGLPLDKILQYREDVKNQPKQKLKIKAKLTSLAIGIRYYAGRLRSWLFD